MAYLPKLRPSIAAFTRAPIGLAAAYCALTMLLAAPGRAQTVDIDEEVGLEVDVDIWVRVYDSDGDIVFPSPSGPSGCASGSPINDYCMVPATAPSPDWNVECYLEPGTATTDWVFWWFENGVPTADFVTFELATQPDIETVIGRYVYVSYHRYAPGASFYRPDDDIGTPDVSFRVFSDYTLKATRGRVTIPDDYFEDTLGPTYVLPYDLQYYCAEQGCSPLLRSYFLAPVTEVPTTSLARFTFSAATDAIIDSEWNLTWSDPGLVLQFPTGRRLVIEGALNATDVDFTAAPSATNGWGGIRFEPQSGGTIQGGSIQGVGDWEGIGVAYAVDIRGIEGFAPVTQPTITGVDISNPGNGNVVGVYVSGANTFPWLDDNTIHDLWAGVVLNAGARARLTRNTIHENTGDGLTAGPATTAYLSPHPTLGLSSLGNIFDNNEGRGIYATSSAAIWFGFSAVPEQGFHANGYNSAPSNGLSGVEATNGAVLYAGTPSYQRYNRFFDNTGDDATASGKDSRAWVSCDWWDDTTPPFRTSATGGAILDGSYYLTADPYDPGPPPSCVTASFEGGGSAALVSGPGDGFGEGNGGSTAREWLLAAVEVAAERPPDAFVLLQRVIDEAPDSPEAIAAIAEVGGLLLRPNSPTEAQGLLETYAAGTRPALRTAAQRALVVSLHRAGDVEGALARTNALVAPGASWEDLLFGQTARVYLYAETGRWTEAAEALANVETLAPGSMEARLGRWHLLETPAGASGSAAHAALASASTGSSAAAFQGYALGPVVPNPTSGAAAVALSLAGPSRVRLVVHDILGRELVVLAQGMFEAGAHSLAVPGLLRPGVYVARAQVESGGMPPRALSVSFSVVP